jgi:hypothetical protein
MPALDAELPADLVERVLQLPAAAKARLRALLEPTTDNSDLAGLLRSRWAAHEAGEPGSTLEETLAAMDEAIAAVEKAA